MYACTGTVNHSHRCHVQFCGCQYNVKWSSRIPFSAGMVKPLCFHGLIIIIDQRVSSGLDTVHMDLTLVCLDRTLGIVHYIIIVIILNFVHVDHTNSYVF